MQLPWWRRCRQHATICNSSVIVAPRSRPVPASLWARSCSVRSPLEDNEGGARRAVALPDGTQGAGRQVLQQLVDDDPAALHGVARDVRAAAARSVGQGSGGFARRAGCSRRSAAPRRGHGGAPEGMTRNMVCPLQKHGRRTLGAPLPVAKAAQLRWRRPTAERAASVRVRVGRQGARRATSAAAPRPKSSGRPASW